MNLYNILKINKDIDYKEIDEIYKNIPDKTKEQYLAWKILRDKYYSKIYNKYLNINKIYNAGFIDDKLSLDDINFYKLNLFTTPFNKILDNIKDKENPIVILSTGGFCPIHTGHIHMMEVAKDELEKIGYDVVGGYFSPSHDNYVLTKPNIKINAAQRIYNCQKSVESSDWLMIDPFEAIYVKTYVNFTDIINRLELYLQKYVDKRIKVAYVFGADNAEFMYCFENQGIGICINRYGYQDIFNTVKKNINNENNIYISKDLLNNNISSRNIRKNEEKTDNASIEGIYIIRNEKLLPFKKINKKTDTIKLITAQRNAINKLKELFNSALNCEIKIVDVDNQINIAANYLKNKKTISLDPYYEGTYNLNVSRQFEICDLQQNFTKMISRNIIDISSDKFSDKYILVDDDSVSGNTIKFVKNNFLNNIEIYDTYFLASQNNCKIFDVVDFRDFIIGSENGGLVVRISNDKYIRAPYINPFVSLFTRANIPVEKEKEISCKIIDINIEFYNNINKNIKLNDLSKDTIYLFTTMGYNRNCYILDILNELKNNLK